MSYGILLSEGYDMTSIIVNEIAQGNTINLIESQVAKTRWFKIKYYHKGQGKEVTRYGNWDDNCRVWLTKNNDIAVCYLQVDDNNEPEGYRTATGVVDIQGKPKKDLFDTEPRVWDNISRLDS